MTDRTSAIFCISSDYAEFRLMKKADLCGSKVERETSHCKAEKKKGEKTPQQ